MSRSRGALRVLLGLAASSPTAYRHPVQISPHAFVCDLCGERAAVTGPGDRADMRHRCPAPVDMLTDIAPGAWQYGGVAEHLRSTWAYFRNGFPTRLRPSERAAARRLNSETNRLWPWFAEAGDAFHQGWLDAEKTKHEAEEPFSKKQWDMAYGESLRDLGEKPLIIWPVDKGV